MSKKAVASIRSSIVRANTLLDVERVKSQITNAAVTRVIGVGDRVALLGAIEAREREINVERFDVEGRGDGLCTPRDERVVRDNF